MKVASIALPSLVETWIWRRKECSGDGTIWWALMAQTLQGVLACADEVFGRFSRERPRRVDVLYTAGVELILDCEGTQMAVSTAGRCS